MRTSLWLLTVFFLPVPLAKAETVDYSRDVKPILKERCFACHGALAQKANLRLDAGSLILKGGKHGPVIKQGDSARSVLVDRITRKGDEESGRMPPEGPPLTERQVAILKEWIDQGARYPIGDKPQLDPRGHWAFRPARRPSVPNIKDAIWARNPVDAFVLAHLESRGLVPTGPADKPTLLRRVYLDLIGLPPTREELHAFLEDTSADAYEKIVDRLLQSPAYGERWARHWMDVWRYSDWYGRRAVPDVLNSYARMFRWRDWIVRSLNDDRGYDWMVQQMLAADEINPTEDEHIVATGFIARNFYRWNYNSWMKDLVEHTGKAFLGLTLNCCQCHDHKYDPITNKEYFAFRAFFEPLEMRHDRVPGEPDPGVYPKYEYAKSYAPIQSGMIRVVDEKLDAKTFMYTGGDARLVIPGRPHVEPAAPAFLHGDKLKIEAVTLPSAAWYPGLKPFVQQEEMYRCQAAIVTADGALAKSRAAAATFERAAFLVGAPVWIGNEQSLWARRADEAQAVAARSALRSLAARIAADKAKYLAAPGDPNQLARVAGKAERQAMLDGAVAAQVQAEAELGAARRNPKAKTKVAQLEKQVAAKSQAVSAARAALASDQTTYTPLSPVYPNKSTGRRAALARWIASRDNPLTPRVAVNHIWGWHFSRPLAETTHDLGRNGKRPSHPELLDYLAAEFMDSGWSLKHINRLIVTSNAYRMKSQAAMSHPGRAIDPDNRLLWRFPTQRMEAEQVRDSVLHLAGELDPTRGGLELPQEQGLTTRRRSLYYATHGEQRMQLLDLFDAADPCECYRRVTSVLPQQALAMVNSEFAARQGRTLARKLWTSLPLTPDKEDAFVRAVFEHVLGRSPTRAERSAVTEFFNRQATLFPRPAISSIADGSAPSPDPATRARENLVQALLNHSDFVTIR